MRRLHRLRPRADRSSMRRVLRNVVSYCTTHQPSIPCHSYPSLFAFFSPSPRRSAHNPPIPHLFPIRVLLIEFCRGKNTHLILYSIIYTVCIIPQNSVQYMYNSTLRSYLLTNICLFLRSTASCSNDSISKTVFWYVSASLSISRFCTYSLGFCACRPLPSFLCQCLPSSTKSIKSLYPDSTSQLR